MKKTISLILILSGATLLITATLFWIDTTTSTQPPSFGESLRDWMTAILGLGASIKGWFDLINANKDKTEAPKVQINISGERDLNVKLHVYPVELYKTRGNKDDVPLNETNAGISQDLEIEDAQDEVSSIYDYVKLLNAKVSQVNFPGIPQFSSGNLPTLQEIYVDQKFVDQKTNHVIPLSSVSSNSAWVKDSAGVGKSTFLKYATSLACTNYLDRVSEKVPLNLHAGDVIGDGHSLSGEVVRIVGEKFNLGSKLLTTIRQHIQNGKSALLIDAIDEIPFESQKRLIELLADSDFINKHNQVLLTSRPLPYLEFNIAELQISRFKQSDAFRLISNWQNVLEKNHALTTKADDYLENFKGSFIGDIYNSGGVRADIVETPLFLVFLILYLSSPSTDEEKEPLKILTSKTRLLARIVEHVIPYWESQKRNKDLISSTRKYEALQVLYLIGFLTKNVSTLTRGDLLWGIEKNQEILSMDFSNAKEYLLLWEHANVMNFNEGHAKFWHEEIRDFCAARHLSILYKRDFMDETDLDYYLVKPEWRSVAFYLTNILRQGDVL